MNDDIEHNDEIEKPVKRSHFNGPLPPPDVLLQYDKVHPGFAEKILAMAEKEQNIRIELERRALESEIRARKLGQIYALSMVTILLSTSIFLIIYAHEAVGVILGSITILSLAYIFVSSKTQEDKETGRDEDGPA